MTAYYNENDPRAAAWLRELIKNGHIAQGEVDERSIADVEGSDLSGYTQCHFFAGIGGWSYALRLAGWADARPVWTGSCPCQPFSVAGKGLGTADKRHLWPEFARLISECRPASVFGEQVASKDGRVWLAGVRVDLEALGYAVGAADLCAAGVGAPHIRQRLYWVADASSTRAGRDAGAASGEEACLRGSRDSDGQHGGHAPIAGGATGGLADSNGGQSSNEDAQRSGQHGQQSPDGGTSGMVNTNRPGQRKQRGTVAVSPPHVAAELPGHAGAWADFDVLACTDGKSRRVESGTFPLAHGIPARMGRLRGYGNAIVPQVAAQFIEAATQQFN